MCGRMLPPKGRGFTRDAGCAMGRGSELEGAVAGKGRGAQVAAIAGVAMGGGRWRGGGARLERERV